MVITLFSQGQIFSNLHNVLSNECAYVKVHSLVLLLPVFQYCIAYSQNTKNDIIRGHSTCYNLPRVGAGCSTPGG